MIVELNESEVRVLRKILEGSMSLKDKIDNAKEYNDGNTASKLIERIINMIEDAYWNADGLNFSKKIYDDRANLYIEWEIGKFTYEYDFEIAKVKDGFKIDVAKYKFNNETDNEVGNSVVKHWKASDVYSAYDVIKNFIGAR